MSAQGTLYGSPPLLHLARLRYFVAVAEHGSLTAAARVLGLTQPSLSMAMQLLERDLGTKLLLRDRSGVTPTATGVELLRRAPDLLVMVHASVGLSHLESGYPAIRTARMSSWDLVLVVSVQPDPTQVSVHARRVAGLVGKS